MSASLSSLHFNAREYSREAAGKAPNTIASFKNQRPENCCPAFVREREIGFGQIQAVVPIGRTALEVFENTGDEEFLENAWRVRELSEKLKSSY